MGNKVSITYFNPYTNKTEIRKFPVPKNNYFTCLELLSKILEEINYNTPGFEWKIEDIDFLTKDEHLEHYRLIEKDSLEKTPYKSKYLRLYRRGITKDFIVKFPRNYL